MDSAAELGRNPVSKHQIQPEHGDEQTDAGRNCRNRLARPNSQARTGTGKTIFPCSQLIMGRIGNLARLILTLAICDYLERAEVAVDRDGSNPLKERGYMSCVYARPTKIKLEALY